MAKSDKQYRLCVGEVLEFDLSGRLYELMEYASLLPGFVGTPTPGWYIGTYTQPVLDLSEGKDYYLLTPERQWVRITPEMTHRELVQYHSHVYDSQKRQCVHFHEVRRLRKTPVALESLSRLFKAACENELVRFSQAFKRLVGNEHWKTIDEMILLPLVPDYFQQYYATGRCAFLEPEQEDALLSIHDILEEHVMRPFSRYIRANPWLLFDVKLVRDTLLITVENDYRIQEWERMELLDTQERGLEDQLLGTFNGEEA